MSLRDSLRKQSIKSIELEEIDSSIDYDSIKRDVLNGLKDAFEKKIAEKDFKQTFHYLGTVSKYHYNASTEMSIDFELKELLPVLNRLSSELTAEFDEIYYQLGENYYDTNEISKLIDKAKSHEDSILINVYANLYCNRDGVIK
jgi:hypothetical protein